METKHYLGYAHTAQSANQENLDEERIDWSFHIVAGSYADAWKAASTHVAWTHPNSDAFLIAVVEHPTGRPH